MKLYNITNWGELFENNRTRELKKLDWIPVPNKQDGEGYTLAMEQKDGPALIGAWLVILQIASKCGTRGTLMRDTGIPHDSASIARQSRFPKAVIERALDFFSSREVQWVNALEINIDAQVSRHDAEIPHDNAEIPQEGITEGKGREGKEEKGMEDGSERAAYTAPATISPQSDDEWLSGLSASPAYEGIDVRREFAKCSAWCATNRKQASRRRFINWLNRCEKPIAASGSGGLEERFRKW